MSSVEDRVHMVSNHTLPMMTSQLMVTDRVHPVFHTTHMLSYFLGKHMSSMEYRVR